MGRTCHKNAPIGKNAKIQHKVPPHSAYYLRARMQGQCAYVLQRVGVYVEGVLMLGEHQNSAFE